MNSAEQTPMNTISGHCLCRAVAFSYEDAPNWTLHCHCESCRRATSAPMATWISVPRTTFRFTAGKPAYFASSPGVRRGFCARCGSPLTYENERVPDEIHLLAGALDDPQRVRALSGTPQRIDLFTFRLLVAAPGLKYAMPRSAMFSFHNFSCHLLRLAATSRISCAEAF